MRIIAGEFRHRKLISPPDATVTRPIPDRVKEALFNLLRGWTEGATVLDVFAGSGAIGLEAVSRGAARCVFVERDRRIAELLQKNIDMLGCTDRCDVIRADALGPALLTRCPRDIDLMFFDPPYPLVQTPEGWERTKLQFSRAMEMMKDKSFAILRTPWPFRHRIGDQPVEEAPEPREGRRKWRHEEEEEEKEDRIWEGEDLRELEAGGYAAAMDDVDDGYDDEDDDFDGDDGEEGWDDDGDVDEHAEHDEEGDAEELTGHWEPVDLTMPNANGPETHVYGSTAIHLYMRKPAATT